MNKNSLMVFGNEEFGNIRVIVKDNEPWFVAKDLSQILGYVKLESMYKRIDNDDMDKIDPQSEEYQGLRQDGLPFEPNSNIRILAIINESGLPEAKKFKKWVTSEVLPSIRKHGVYMTDSAIEKTLTNSDFIIQLATQLKEEKEKRIEAEIKLEEQQPKVEIYNAVMDTKGLMNFIQLGDSFGIGRNTLFEILRQEKVLMSGENTKNMPYAQYMKRGLFTVKVSTRKTSKGMEEICTPLGTTKSLKLIHKVLKKRNLLKEAI